MSPRTRAARASGSLSPASQRAFNAAATSLTEGAASVRMLSGQLLLFYLIPLMYFRFVEPRLRDGDGPSHP